MPVVGWMLVGGNWLMEMEGTVHVRLCLRLLEGVKLGMKGGRASFTYPRLPPMLTLGGQITRCRWLRRVKHAMLRYYRRRVAKQASLIVFWTWRSQALRPPSTSTMMKTRMLSRRIKTTNTTMALKRSRTYTT